MKRVGRLAELLPPRLAALARDVSARWRARKYRFLDFPEVAAACLEAHRPHEWLRPEEILRWCLAAPALPAQASLTKQFGDPPITLYRDERFYIDAYFWVDPAISVHDHAFNGAFTVLHGASLHCRYRFPVADAGEKRLLLGDLSVGHAETLKAGVVRPIVAGSEFIHDVWHLARPTVSLVIRTPRTLGSQFVFLKNRLAVDVLAIDPALVKRIGVLEYLNKLGRPGLDALVKTQLRRSDPYTAYLMMSAYLEMTADADRRLAMMECLGRAHPSFLQPMLEAFRSEAEEEAIRWEELVDEGSRLLVAALFSELDLRTTLGVIAELYPGGSPGVRAYDELAALAAGGAAGFTLSAAELRALRAVLTGAGAVATAAGTRKAALPAASVLERLRERALLRPLLAGV